MKKILVLLLFVLSVGIVNAMPDFEIDCGYWFMDEMICSEWELQNVADEINIINHRIDHLNRDVFIVTLKIHGVKKEVRMLKHKYKSLKRKLDQLREDFEEHKTHVSETYVKIGSVSACSQEWLSENLVGHGNMYDQMHFNFMMHLETKFYNKLQVDDKEEALYRVIDSLKCDILYLQLDIVPTHVQRERCIMQQRADRTCIDQPLNEWTAYHNC